MKNYRLNFLNLIFTASVVAAVSLLAAGCGNKTVKLTSDLSKAFDGAPAEVKNTWDKALAADHANDYVNTQTLLDSLRTMNLNSQQTEALDTQLASFQQRLLQAADKNDPIATKAIQEIDQSKKRR